MAISNGKTASSLYYDKPLVIALFSPSVLITILNDRNEKKKKKKKKHENKQEGKI